jgi:hypothetical protein
MKASRLVLALLFLFPSPSFAGQLYGTFRESGRPVGPNISVVVVCNGNKYTALTDNYGTYKLFAKENGRCTLSVSYQNQTLQAPIDSYPSPAQYDFDLIRQSTGQYELRRK